MFFLITGKDGSDEKAFERRQEARPAHLDCCEKLKKQGFMLFGAALLDDQGRMTGSVIVVQAENREAVDHYLATEPYVLGKVWLDIEVQQIAVGNLFLPEAMRV
ncbi:MAG: YciI family protein [Candidatus Obscuribacterales bacterium]|jgi:uncharacterized protein YciI|nr:YciI family protein [Candidatus Obscuribacterales bacterium]